MSHEVAAESTVKSPVLSVNALEFSYGRHPAFSKHPSRFPPADLSR